MTKTKVTFEKRVPVVLTIIRDAETPISYTEIYKKLKEETGVEISKTTLNRCLKYLLSTFEISKIEEKGQGNPVKYFPNNDFFIYKTPERIAFNACWLDHFAEDYSPYGTEANLWNVLGREISIISISLISALSYYSQRRDRNKAYEDYCNTIKVEIVPHMLALHKLVKPPIQMCRTTEYLLHKLFHEDVFKSLEKPLHPFMKITPKQQAEIDLLIKEKMAKDGIEFTTKVPYSIDLDHIRDSDYIKETIKYYEIMHEIFCEVEEKGNRNPKLNKDSKAFIKKLDEFDRTFSTDTD